MRIQCLQHVPFEGPAAIADWADARGHVLTTTPLFDGAAVPDPSGFEWLVVMGGPMGVHDEQDHPWLAPEKALVAESIAAGRTVVGICLGAQLIASALGARVYRNPEKEIGWMPVDLTEQGRVSRLFGTLPPRIKVFHWHGDTFDLPAGAVHLARSAACAHQAFSHGNNVLGLQFHLESTPKSVADIVANCAEDITPAQYVQNAERMLSAGPDEYTRIQGALFAILDRLAAPTGYGSLL